MLGFENQNVEFKQEYVQDIRKEVMVFINSEGGTVLVGVRKDGTVIGVENPDEVMLQTANSLKDSLVPDESGSGNGFVDRSENESDRFLLWLFQRNLFFYKV